MQELLYCLGLFLLQHGHHHRQDYKSAVPKNHIGQSKRRSSQLRSVPSVSNLLHSVPDVIRNIIITKGVVMVGGNGFFGTHGDAVRFT